MHDPLTLIYHCSFFDLWHVDPGIVDDDTCGWMKPKLSQQEIDFAENMIDPPDSFWRGIFVRHSDDEENHANECKDHIRYLIRGLKKETRPWWQHPRFHFWHWKINIFFIQNLKRWLFSRCQTCNKRFPWGYAPVGGYDGSGPMWFKSEIAWHYQCCERDPEA